MQAEQTSFLFGANAPFIEELYARFLDDPSRVDADWRIFFEALAEERGDVLAEVRGASWAPNGARVIDVPDTEMPRAAANRNVNAGKGTAMPLAGRTEEEIRAAAYDTSRAFLLIRSYRIRGHLEATSIRSAWCARRRTRSSIPRPTASRRPTGTGRS